MINFPFVKKGGYCFLLALILQCPLFSEGQNSPVQLGSTDESDLPLVKHLRKPTERNATMHANANLNPSSNIGGGVNRYVNDKSTAGDHYTTAIGNDANAGTSSAPFATLNHAISMSAPGDVIYVDAGTYREDVVIDKTLSFHGSNYGRNPNTSTRLAESIIQPGTSNPDPYSLTATVVVYFTFTASNSSFDGFTVDGDNPTLTSTVNINGANVDASDGIGEYEGLSNTTIIDNIIKNTNYSGVDFGNAGNSGGPTSGNVVTNNKFINILPSQFGIGVIIYDNCYTSITTNVMESVRVGIQTGNFYLSDPGNNHTISNNIINSRRVGIFHNLHYQAATSFDVKNNVISAYQNSAINEGIRLFSFQTAVTANVENNTIAGGKYGYSVWNIPTTSGMIISGGSVSSTTKGVVFANVSGYGDADGNGNLSIRNVSFNNNLTGINAFDDPANTNGSSVTLSATNNFITGGSDGFKYEGSKVVGSAHDNSITNQSNEAVNGSMYTGTSPINATCNWYGNYSGPNNPANPGGTGGKVSGNVTFAPWLTNGTDANASMPGFQPVPNSCNSNSIKCGDKNDKVIVCHHGYELCINPNAVPAHLAHGDYVGHCNSSPITNTSEPDQMIKQQATPEKYALSNFPNPFKNKTTIRFALPNDAKVQISILNTMGVLLTTLVNADKKAGSYAVYFDASTLNAGMYYYKIMATSAKGVYMQTEKLQVVK